MRFHIWRHAFLAALLVLATGAPCAASPPPPPAPPANASDADQGPTGFPIYFRGEEIGRVLVANGSFTPEERALGVETRLNHEILEVGVHSEQVTVVHDETASRILGDGRLLVLVTEADAHAAGRDRHEYAEQLGAVLRRVIAETNQEFDPHQIFISSLRAAGLVGLCLVVIYLVVRSSRRLLKKIQAWRVQRVGGVHVGSSQMASRLPAMVAGLVRIARVVLLATLVLGTLERVMILLPWTRPSANLVVRYLADPIGAMWHSFIDYLPNAVFLIAIAVATYIVLSLMRLLFAEIARGTIELENFPPEWATPTFNLLRVLVIALAFVAAFPYIPGSKSPAFQGVSIFLGLLVSLSSSSAISNVIAGAILTYTSAFKMGDRVRIGESEGDVVKTALLVTQVRTIKNEVVSIPNATVLSVQVVNYSRLAKSAGLILHTEVTIGYSSPWRTVHALLIDAALRTPGILSEPAPFVLQRTLSDFYVAYQLNAYTRDARGMIDTYSFLHQAIQDSFAAGGVEIMSPHYTALRSGRESTIPDTTGSSDVKAG
jgi:small-conductance mechanosensitive channel